MITLELIKRIWHLIQPPEPGQLEPAQELEQIKLKYGSPLLTIDSENKRHILLPFDPMKKTLDDKHSAGVHIIINTWGSEGEKRKFIDVVCMKPNLNELFDLMVFDILSELEKDPKNPSKTCHGVLNKWRELIRKEASQLPDKVKLIGIFGELQMLRILTKYDPGAQNGWLGPKAGKHDFLFGQTAFEIKTSEQRKGRTVVIHGHDQLEPPSGGELYLERIQVAEESDGESIPELIEDLVELGSDQVELLASLNKLGVSVQGLAELRELRFKIIESRMYKVDEAFPKIIAASFTEKQLPNGVLSIEYQIDLSTEPPFPLSFDDSNNLITRIFGSSA